MSSAGRKVHDQVVFKPYQQHQTQLPFDLESLIPANHKVKIVNHAIDQMNLDALLAKYPGGGSSSFHPVMMTKLIIYAYTDKIYSSRRIEKAARENILYMWLCGGNTPDFKTINSFRSERMKDVIENVFGEVVDFLLREGFIKFENYFLDGTKIEANASQYSWVWGKSTRRYKTKLREKCKEVCRLAEQVNEAENEEYGDRNLEEIGEGKQIDSQALAETVERINQKLAKSPQDKTLKKAKKQLEKDYLPRMKKYEQQELLLAERSSYAKTDTDATFMRMKEDHMKNGQLKPGYNVQMGTENQYVLGYSVHQEPGDTSCFKDHLQQLKKQRNGELPANIVADAGYGSEENYDYLEDQQLGNYVKYNTFHKEATKKWRTDPTRVQNWHYDEESDSYRCGFGRTLRFAYEKKATSKKGYESWIRVYESDHCEECPYRADCVKKPEVPGYKRRIYINRRGDELRATARANLTSETGLALRSLRPIEVESAFGDIKGNFGVRRFLLRGLEKVKLEWGLYCIAHNMRKLATSIG
jgi:transposase